MSLSTAIRTVPPSNAVVERIAASEGVEPTELPLLIDVIDPEALDALVEGPTACPQSPLEIEFTYHGYDVTVTAEGVIHLDEAG